MPGVSCVGWVTETLDLNFCSDGPTGGPAPPCPPEMMRLPFGTCWYTLTPMWNIEGDSDGP